ncbi:transposase [Pedobacter psychrophilus]|uniref:Transposase n=1 Tax=Pedobacter psychrophilus TaxID=1826909 RepID=A0A179DMG2_9SPHI|nr:transposase [Pedobacter psychrophilus]OAQ42094.1 transposase [Pedobacter psychrophilus]
MATRYRFGDNENAHFVTFAVVHWIDVFSREDYKEILVESLRFCIKEKGLNVYAWVIMTNHVNLIIACKEGFKQADVLRDLKKFTAKTIIKAIEENSKESRKDWMIWMFKRAGAKNSNNKVYQFWQQDNHPIELSTLEMIQQKLDYIHQNPTRAGIVFEPEYYKYSSASDYHEDKEGLLPIEKMF